MTKTGATEGNEMTYQITNTTSGAFLDEIEAENELSAWQAHMARVGYPTQDLAQSVGLTLSDIPDDICVQQIDVTITAVGGTSFDVRRGDEYLGRFEFGDIDDDDGQYVGDDNEIIEAARDEFNLGVAEFVCLK